MSLALVLVSCSAAYSLAVGPTGPRELSRYVIVLAQQPDGQVVHAWIPLKEFELTKFQHAMSTRNVRREIVRVSSSTLDAYCEGRYDQCMNDCLNNSRPFTIGRRKYMDTRTQPWRIARGWWCRENCMEALVECKKGRGEWAGEYAAEFDAIEPAIDWLKKHRTELVVGSVVVIAGVAFAVAVAGSGGAALVLTPLLVMAELSPGMLPEAQLVGACQ